MSVRHLPLWDDAPAGSEHVAVRKQTDVGVVELRVRVKRSTVMLSIHRDGALSAVEISRKDWDHIAGIVAGVQS